MYKLKLYFILTCFHISVAELNAQSNLDVKFGKINSADFQSSPLNFDSNANAIILSDIGKTSFEGNNSGFFGIVYTRFMRVKIINKNGFDAGGYSILLYDNRNGTSEKITELKGITYNLENGIVQQTKLDEKSVYEEKYSTYRQSKKFTMPALKAGSIFDVTYTIKSNYFSDPPTWSFQGSYPRLWSEYEVTIPSMFHYLLKTRGDAHYDIKTTKAVNQTYLVRRNGGAIETDDMINVSCTAFQNRWVKKNVPVLKQQPYVSTLKNYESSIYFELEYFKQDEEHEKAMELKTWDKECENLLKNENFGYELDRNNSWLESDLGRITSNSLSSEEEIKRIYNYVRDNFLCTGISDIFMNSSLKEIYRKKAGTEAELNLLLTAMLRNRNMDAMPAILSTRDNGVVTKNVPLIYEYNYVICVVRVGGKLITLDASEPFNSFGKLPTDCYNWTARIINVEHPDSIDLSPDSVVERKLTSVMIINNEKGELTGTYNTVFGDDESYDIRDEVKTTSQTEYFKKIRNSYSDLKISNEQFDSLKKSDYPLTLHCDVDFKELKDADIFYFTPVISSEFQKNPFVDAERLYPVEIPYKMDFTYVLSMEVPKGFKVDEIPKSARVKLNENEGMFEYLIQQNTESIQMRVHLKLNQSTFTTDEYPTIRDFFAYVVKKESEQIVFKKIK